jgi:hypothetical protein
MQCPHGDVNMFYYKRKLSVYNLTVYNLGTGSGNCFMWDETVAGRGSCEIGSCILSFLLTCSRNGAREVTLYSDNCGGQNRNRFIVCMYVYALMKTELQIIRHVFLEKGHTQNENDSIHATIESAKKHSGFIYVPSQYYTLARSARKTKDQYVVKEMDRCDFYDFKHMAKSLKNFEVDERNETLKWGKIRQIMIDQDALCKLHYKYEHSADGYYRLDMLRRNTNRTSRKVAEEPEKFQVDQLQVLRRTPIRLSKAKYTDLISLCSQHLIPSTYHQFYEGLPHTDKDDVTQADDIPDEV